MKSIILALVVAGSHFAFADDYSVDRVIASSAAAKAASEFLLNVDDVKDRPFTVQVASHLNEVNAIEHVKELKALQETAFYYPNFVKNQVYFKVCVGRFASKVEAEKFVATFIKRTSETFSSVISLMDRPGADKKATAAQVSSAESMKFKSVQKRSIASVSEKSIDLVNEAEAKPTKAPAMDALKKPISKAAHTIAANMPMTAKPATITQPEDTTAEAPATLPPMEEKSVSTDTVTAPIGAKSYSVQIAAYPNEEMAKVASAKVEANGKNVFYKEAVVEGKTWYRLFVGKFDKFADATAFKKEIEGTYDSPIVRKLYE